MNEHQNNEPYFITEEIATEMKTAGYVFEQPAHVSALRLRDVLANRKRSTNPILPGFATP